MIFRILTTCFALCALAISLAPAQDAPAAGALETEEQKTLYAMGLLISQSLVPLEFSEEELAVVQMGIEDGALGREAKVDLDAFGPRVQGMALGRSQAVVDREKAAGAEFLQTVEQEPGAVKTDSGMIYIELEAGTGETPQVTDSVRLHYHGTLRDGEVFDSSREKGEPAIFPLGGVAPCFAEGLQRMKVGGKAKFGCPAELAYGDRGFPGVIPGGASLLFEVELLEIMPQAAEAAPEEPPVSEAPPTP